MNDELDPFEKQKILRQIVINRMSTFSTSVCKLAAVFKGREFTKRDERIQRVGNILFATSLFDIMNNCFKIARHNVPKKDAQKILEDLVVYSKSLIYHFENILFHKRGKELAEEVKRSFDEIKQAVLSYEDLYEGNYEYRGKNDRTYAIKNNKHFIESINLYVDFIIKYQNLFLTVLGNKARHMVNTANSLKKRMEKAREQDKTQIDKIEFVASDNNLW